MLAPGSIAIMVKDAERAAKWYTQKLGFEIVEDEDHWITVAPRGAKVEYHLCEGKLEPGNTGIAFVTNNVRRAEKELRDRGVKFTTHTTEEDWGSYAQFSDPDGNEFWLSEDAEAFADRSPRSARAKASKARRPAKRAAPAVSRRGSRKGARRPRAERERR